MSDTFSVSEETIDERRVLAVSGEIDLFTAPALKQGLADAISAGYVRIAVDLTDTTFVDSTALGVLIGARKRLREQDGQLTIVVTNPTITRTMEITGLDGVFTIVGSREQALAELSSA